MLELGGLLYEMVIRADRQIEGERSPSQEGDEAAPTWRCVISLKPNWYMPINPRHYDLILLRTHTLHVCKRSP